MEDTALKADFSYYAALPHPKIEKKRNPGGLR